MTENELYRIIKAALDTGLAARGIQKVTVKRNYQAQQEGAVKGNALYFNRVGPNKRHGSPRRTDEWDQENEKMIHTESQKIESTFQITAQCEPDMKDIKAMTASDLADYAAAILQSDATIASFRDKKVGILRVTEVRNTYMSNEKDQFEASPSFDITLTHDQTDISETPAVETFEFNVQRV